MVDFELLLQAIDKHQRRFDKFLKDPLVVDPKGSNLLIEYFTFAKPVNYTVVKQILDAKVPVNHLCGGGRSALLWACMNKTTPREVYQLLLDEGADVNVIDEDKETVMRRYLVKQYPYDANVIKMFIRAGYDFQMLEQKRFKII